MSHLFDILSRLNYDLPWFMDELDEDVYLHNPWIMLDFETTNIEKGNPLNPDNRMVCAAWATSMDREIKYHKGDEYHQQDLYKDISSILRNRGFIIAHNTKFECHWLMRMGFEPQSLFMYDTMLGEYVLGGNRWQYMHLGLDKVNRKYGGTGKAKVVDALIKGGVCPSEIPEQFLEARVRKDVADLAQIFYKQRRKLKDRGQLAIAFTRNIFTPCLADIERQGIGLDSARVYEEYVKASEEMGNVDAELAAMMGDLNWKSTVDKATFLYDTLKFKELHKKGKPIRTGGGKPKTDVDTIEKLQATTKKQKKFKELLAKAASANAALSKTLAFFKGTVDEYDGIFYGQFNQAATQTQRLSSSGLKKPFQQFAEEGKASPTKSVQFQNFPRKFKDLMGPKDPKNRIGEVDGSQLEFRGAAFLGQDSQAIADIEGDVDIHIYTASVINQVPEKEVTKAQRQDAKPDTFGPLYGKQQGTKGQMAYFKAFREKYSELFDVQTGWTYEVLKNKKLRTAWGLEYHWPHTRMSQSGYIDNTTNIFNYPIQAISTAEIIPLAITFMWHRMYQNLMDTKIINTVHDSAIAEVVPGEEKMWRDIGLHAFTMDVYTAMGALYDIEFNVPLGAGITLGARWSSPDAVETEINVDGAGDYWFKGTRLDPRDTKAKAAWNKIGGHSSG